MNAKIFFKKSIENFLNSRRNRKGLEEKNLKRFREFVEFVERNSAFYKKIIHKNNIDCTACVPKDFPVLTKEILMENFDDIVTSKEVTKRSVIGFLSESRNPFELLHDKYYVVHTSGSSGVVGYFVYSKEDWSRNMAQNLKLPIANLLKMRKKLAYYGVIDGHYAGVTLIAAIKNSLFKHLYPLEICGIDEPLKNVVERLNRFKPDILTGYPSAIRILAEKQSQNELNINPFLIETSAEVLNTSDRNAIEKSFPNAEVINLYCSSEHLIMGISRPQYNGMYLNEDDLIFDINKDSLYVTNIFNYTLPLIRYKMNDSLIPETEDKEEISPYTKVKEILGRIENSPVFLNKHGLEDSISSLTISAIYVKGLAKFQMKVMNKEAFIFSIVPQRNMDDESIRKLVADVDRRISEILVKKEMENVSCYIKVVDKIDVDAHTGKFKLIQT
ncbi:MAG: hypothetical protein HUU50_11050 [Candidatus Brocadiae bacterium]|nr:hypothetical protein [Candidatus Brocadiia bacterium]